MAVWIRSLLRLSPTVALVSVISVVGLFAFRAVAPLADLRDATDAIGGYLQTVGSIYAVLLAFVVYAVWNQFNEARGYLDREATALVDLHRTASGLPAGSRDAIQRGLRAYVDAVTREEWVAMTCHDEAVVERVSGLLEHVWLAIHACRPASACQHTVYGEVLSRFNQLTDLRTSRLTAASARIPGAMVILLYTGAVLTIGSVYLLSFRQVWLHVLVTGALAGAIAHILYLIRDLDDAFSGDCRISQVPLERARRSFERSSHGVDADAG